MALIYALRVALKSSTNLHFAKKQMKETQKYITQKSNCKAEMDRVDVHIKESVKVLKDYEILLNEQAGKLKRIFYFEKKKTKSSEFQGQSMRTIKESQGLIEHIQKFITTPMSEEGRLSEWKVNSLVSAKEHIEKLLKSY
jgi:chaperonin cofactor prefoldin